MATRNLADMGLNLQKIISRLQSNQNLLKLVYYTNKDPLNEQDLTDEQIKNEIYNKLIKIAFSVIYISFIECIAALIGRKKYGGNEY